LRYATLAGTFASPESVNSNTSAAAAERTYLVDASGGTRTITLPTAVGIAGKEYVVKKTDTSANVVAVATTSSQTIDGAASPWNIRFFNENLTFVSDGANWHITAESIDLPLEDIRDVALTSPTDGQALKYHAASQTWTNQADATGGGGGGPAWMNQSGAGAIFALHDDGDPVYGWAALRDHGVSLSPTQHSTTVIRLVKFRLPKALSVSNVRVPATGPLSAASFAIYRVSDGVRMWTQTPSLVSGWNDLTSGTPFSLAVNTDYWWATAATAGDTNAFLIASPNSGGNLSVISGQGGSLAPIFNKGIGIGEYAQKATTAGAFPDPLGTVATPAWTVRGHVWAFLEGTAS
jgi:hypothetical protein